MHRQTQLALAAFAGLAMAQGASASQVLAFGDDCINATTPSRFNPQRAGRKTFKRNARREASRLRRRVSRR